MNEDELREQALELRCITDTKEIPVNLMQRQVEYFLVKIYLRGKSDGQRQCISQLRTLAGEVEG